MNPKLIAASSALALAAAATQASAHAHLMSSNPAANAAGPAPKQIVLQFSEKLQPKFSGLSVTTQSNRPAPVKVAVSNDRKSLTATPARPFAAGIYKVSWHAVTADTHRVQGAYSFTVR